MRALGKIISFHLLCSAPDLFRISLRFELPY
nr:MAG TPA: hypothetical protein [Caudoviricetes sp.]